MYVRMTITDDCEEFLAATDLVILDEHTDECDSETTKHCPELSDPFVIFWDFYIKGEAYPRFEVFGTSTEAEAFADCLIEPLLAQYVPTYDSGQGSIHSVPYRDRFMDLPEHGGPTIRVYVMRVDVNGK